MATREATPGRGVNSLLLGMNRDEVMQLLGTPTVRKEADHDDAGTRETWRYHFLGLDLHFDSEAEWRLVTINLYHLEVSIHGQSFMGASVEDLAANAEAAGLGAIRMTDDFGEFGQCFECDDEAVSFWINDGRVTSVTLVPRYDPSGNSEQWPARSAT